jgi:2-succinyl-6-hydroxy-2,4-cyclohexadiene-1-carboxylate synthase
MNVRLVVRGCVLEASDEGPLGTAPVVLLHGFTGSKATWRGLASRLAPSRRIIAVDLPGHGGSDAIPGNFDDTVSAIAILVETLAREPAALVGYSLGGRLALALTLARPEIVDCLLLESASPGIADESERLARRGDDDALAERIERDGTAAFVDHWERLPLFATLRALPAAERERLRRERLANSTAGLAASLRSVGAGRQPWLGDRLGEIAVPVTLIAGAEDTKYRGIAAAMADRIPQATFHVVARAGHVPHLERPEAFDAIVDRFLAAPAAPRSTERNHEGDAR